MRAACAGSIVDDQSPEAQKHLINRFHTGIGLFAPKRNPDCLSNLQYKFAAADIAQVIS